MALQNDDLLLVNRGNDSYKIEYGNIESEILDKVTNVSYTYPGGVEQTVQTRLEQYVSVQDFGAVGDGVTDDYDAITAAITAAAGKTLIFTSGVYRTSKQIFFKESSAFINYTPLKTLSNL